MMPNAKEEEEAAEEAAWRCFAVHVVAAAAVVAGYILALPMPRNVARLV